MELTHSTLDPERRGWRVTLKSVHVRKRTQLNVCCLKKRILHEFFCEDLVIKSSSRYVCVAGKCQSGLDPPMNKIFSAALISMMMSSSFALAEPITAGAVAKAVVVHELKQPRPFGKNGEGMKVARKICRGIFKRC